MNRDVQLAMFDQSGQPTLKRHTPAHRKAVKGGKGVVEQCHLELKEKRFLPVLTVPANRGECPTERPCPHVRCEWNLATELAEDRAGRPGLSKVPRGHRGWTLSVEGDIGEERAETTLRPIWLGYGWSAKAEIERDDEGRICDVYFVDGVSGPQLGRWEAMEAEDGEVFEVWHQGEMVAMVRADVVEREVMSVDADGNETVKTEKDVTLAFDRSITGVVVEIRRQGEQPSCGLDVIERGGPRTTKEVGQAIGRSASLVRKIVRRALIKLRQEGVSSEEIATLLQGEGE